MSDMDTRCQKYTGSNPQRCNCLELHGGASAEDLVVVVVDGVHVAEPPHAVPDRPITILR